MTNIAIVPSVPTHDPEGLLMPTDPNKDEKYRIGRFASWLEAEGAPWHSPDLEAYRDAMLSETVEIEDENGETRQEKRYAASTVSAHLSTVRARYRRVIRDNGTRQGLFDAMPEGMGLADRKAFVDEVEKRIENALDPAAAPVKQTTVQDEADSDHLRLTKAQADALLAAPGTDTLQALRDTAMIALMLCTGVREAELVALEVEDLRQELGGELALRIRHGKGDKKRLIPYGDLSWSLAIVEKWLAVAGITEGPVFRSFWRGGRKIRPGRLSKRAVGLILGEYPIAVNGTPTTVKPHDCRRTYARRLYEAGMDLVAIQQNLGHASLQTTLGYIGDLDADKRRAPAVYSFDLGALDNFTA